MICNIMFAMEKNGSGLGCSYIAAFNSSHIAYLAALASLPYAAR